MISSIGVKNMVDARVDLNDPKKLMIVAAMLVLGLGTAAAEVDFAIGGFTIGGLGLAAIVGIVLNGILKPKGN
jgi:uracil permease